MHPTTTTSIAPAAQVGQGATTGPAASPGLVPPAGVSTRAPNAAPAGGEDAHDDTDALPLTRAELRQIAAACRSLLWRLDTALALPPARRYPGVALMRQRLDLGLSQQAVATAAGYSRGLVADIEAGRRDSREARAAIAEALIALGRAQETQP